MVTEKAPLMVIQKACCLGSLRAIGLGSVLAVKVDDDVKRKRF